MVVVGVENVPKSADPALHQHLVVVVPAHQVTKWDQSIEREKQILANHLAEKWQYKKILFNNALGVHFWPWYTL